MTKLAKRPIFLKSTPDICGDGWAILPYSDRCEQDVDRQGRLHDKAALTTYRLIALNFDLKSHTNDPRRQMARARSGAKGLTS